MYPETIKILLPPGSPTSAIPEHHLLPNEEEIALKEEKVINVFRKENIKTFFLIQYLVFYFK